MGGLEDSVATTIDSWSINDRSCLSFRKLSIGKVRENGREFQKTGHFMPFAAENGTFSRRAHTSPKRKRGAMLHIPRSRFGLVCNPAACILAGCIALPPVTAERKKGWRIGGPGVGPERWEATACDFLLTARPLTSTRRVRETHHARRVVVRFTHRTKIQGL